MVAGLAKRLPVGRDNCPAVFQRRRRVVSWCGALTNSSSANTGNKLTQVGGVLLVVIHRSKCLFCKLGGKPVTILSGEKCFGCSSHLDKRPNGLFCNSLLFRTYNLLTL